MNERSIRVALGMCFAGALLFGCSAPEPAAEEPPVASRWEGEGSVPKLLRRIEGEGEVEVRLAPGIEAGELECASSERLPWGKALEAFATTNGLRVTEPEEGVVVLVRENSQKKKGEGRKSMRINVDVEDS